MKTIVSILLPSFILRTLSKTSSKTIRAASSLNSRSIYSSKLRGRFTNSTRHIPRSSTATSSQRTSSFLISIQPSWATSGRFIRIAKEYFSNGEEFLNTDTLSTLEYISPPETLSGSIYFKEPDIYSFAVLAYELILERNFSNFTAFQRIDAITNKKYRPSLEDLNDYSDLRDIIEQA